MPTGTYATTRNLYFIASSVGDELSLTAQGVANLLNNSASPSGDADAKEKFAQIANRHQASIMSKVPNLGVNSEDLTVTDGSAPVPEDLSRKTIHELRWFFTGGILSGAPVKFVGKVVWRGLPPEWTNGTATAVIPAYAALDESDENILLAPWPASGTGTLRVLYQTKADLFEGDQYDDPDSEVYSVIPDEYDDVLPMAIAIELARKAKMYEVEDRLRADYYGAPGVRGRLRTFLDEIMRMPAITNRSTYNYGNVPSTAAGNNPTSGQYLGNVPGIR